LLTLSVLLLLLLLLLQLDPLLLLPLLFKLFRVNDKALREMLFRHIIAGRCQQSKGLYQLNV
jgi:hypothetical protein